MTTTMDQIHTIRQLYYEQGLNLSQISEKLGLDWKTVRKYVDKEDFNLPEPAGSASKQHTSKLDPFKETIDSWILADKRAPRKQRHTAKRVHRRLAEEFPEYSCSYRLVADYFSAKKKELNAEVKEGYIPLLHAPGEAQGDFGAASFYENGTLHKGKYFVLSFPNCNAGFLQLNYGENLECLLEALKDIFEYIGGVPTEIWFDNTSTIVTKIIKGGGREITERFQHFSEHYRFKTVFCNPESGNEKGNVENKVGYHRRNLLVPVPEFRNLSEFNKELLTKCDLDHKREHYDKETNISELFEEDKKVLLALPSVPFDTARYITVKTDKYGKFTLNNGKHRYSASPEMNQETVHLKITSSLVSVRDENMREIVVHKRLYGDEKQEQMDWIPYLRCISSKPRSLKSSGIYEIMPEALQKYMDSCSSSDRGKVLKILADLTANSSFEDAMHTVTQAAVHNATDPDSLMNLYRKINSDVPQLPPMPDMNNIPGFGTLPVNTDLTAYDAMLKGGVSVGRS